MVRTKILIYDRPKVLSPLELTTWPEKPGNIRCNRYYTLSQNGTLLAEGKNEWVMLEVETGRLHRIDDAYPEELIHHEAIACDSPFTRIDKDFSDGREIGRYTVRSCDIDTSQHMNNVNYARAVLGAFSCEELAAMPIREMEISYRLQCYEGEMLTLIRRDTDQGCEVGVIKEDGNTAAIVRLVYR